MIRNDNIALLSAESANEIAHCFNAFNSMVGINGAFVIHSDARAKMILNSDTAQQQSANPSPKLDDIKAGDTDTYMSASKLNQLIAAYNKIMACEGDGIIEPKMADGGIVIDVKL